MRFQLLISALALCAIATRAEENPQSPFQELSRGSDTFNANLFKAIANQKESENLICSPLSAHVVLAMAAYGARAFTLWEMSRSLYLPKNKDVAYAGFSSLVDDFNNVKNVSLEIANKIYVDKTFKIKESYKKIATDVFKAEAEELDVSNPAAAAQAINDWVDQKTHHKISKLFEPNSINGNTRMLLLSALYFKGTWAHKFNKQRTIYKPFFITKDQKVNVPMMHIQKTFVYGKLEELKAEFIEIPYVEEDMKMVIILPEEGYDLSNVEKNLGRYNYSYLTENSEERQVRLSMPKFKIESEIDLNQPLKQLLIYSMFGNYANFGDISDEPLKVDQVKQKASIEVNEEGSEASAATAIVIVAKSMFFEPTLVEFNVDRPFYFFIRKSENTMFQGHVYDPSK